MNETAQCKECNKALRIRTVEAMGDKWQEFFCEKCSRAYCLVANQVWDDVHQSHLKYNEIRRIVTGFWKE